VRRFIGFIAGILGFFDRLFGRRKKPAKRPGVKPGEDDIYPLY
jgi:hypothetical protein